MKRILQIAAIYNLVWGAWVIIFPHHYFQWLNLPQPTYPAIWQGVGMIVGVYGLGYWWASHDPVRHWPIVMVGFLGKIFGPIGFLWHMMQETLPWRFGYTTLTNDLVWWIPFGWILWHANRAGWPLTDPHHRLK
jgi:small multidrug resistance pump